MLIRLTSATMPILGQRNQKILYRQLEILLISRIRHLVLHIPRYLGLFSDMTTGVKERFIFIENRMQFNSILVVFISNQFRTLILALPYLRMYWAGGFLRFLPSAEGSGLNDARTIIQDLKEKEWLNNGARILLIDLQVYNLNFRPFFDETLIHRIFSVLQFEYKFILDHPIVF